MRALLTIALVSVTAVASACSTSTGDGGPNGTGSGNANSGSGGSGSGGSGSGGSGSGSSGSGSSGSAGSGSSSSGSAGAGSSGAGSGGGSGVSGGAGASTGGASGSSGAVAQGDGGGAEGGLPPASYPGGPYCKAVGQDAVMPAIPPAPPCIIPNLTWNGYVDSAADAIATSKAYRTYSLLDVYNDARASGKRYAMLNTAEFYCPGCRNSAALMGGTGPMSGRSVVAAGGVMIEVLMTSASTAPMKSDLDSWVGTFALDITSVADLDPSTPTFNELGRRDQAFIIDLKTMKIIQSINGSTGDAGGMNSGPLGMAAMHMLLGK
jgi:hypothetical protein